MFARQAFLFAALIGSVLSCQEACASRRLAQSRPNIVLVMTDDQGLGEIGCLGNPILRTPHLDRLHAESTRFTDFHVSPTCSPTRAALLTGRHEFQNGVTHTILERERLTLQATTIAELLRDAGYLTGIFGKWHLGDEEPYQPPKRGFTEAFIHGAGGIGQAYDCSCADAPPNRPNRYFDPVIRHNGKFVKTHGFCTDLFFRTALGWIKKCKASGRPFFAYIAPNAPHAPMIAPEQYKRRFLQMGFDERSAARLGMIENIDDNMGLLLTKLAEWGLERNTLVIFLTDNGQSYRYGRRDGKLLLLDFSGFKTGKGTPSEGGTHVPCFWRWPGTLSAGRDIPALTAHIDLFPTLAELAGAVVPVKQVRGRSLLPLLEDPNAPWPDRYLFIHVGRWPKGADPNDYKYTRCAVRSARFRLVNFKELYDIQNDPHETANVIDKYPEAVAKMKAAYEAWWAETLPMMVNEKVPNSKVRPFWLLYEKQLKTEGIPDWVPPEL